MSRIRPKHPRVERYKWYYMPLIREEEEGIFVTCLGLVLFPKYKAGGQLAQASLPVLQRCL